MGTQLGIKRLTGAIGVEVSGLNLNAPLNERTFEEVHQAFLDHCLLVFRGQFLKPAALARMLLNPKGGAQKTAGKHTRLKRGTLWQTVSTTSSQ